MLKVKYLHLCDYAFLTAGHKVSLIGIFDHMWAVKFPFTAQPFHIVGVLENEANVETELKIEILDPSGKKVFESGGPVKTGPRGTLNFMLGIGNLKFEKPGTHIVRLLEKGKELTRIELPVLMKEKEPDLPKP